AELCDRSGDEHAGAGAGAARRTDHSDDDRPYQQRFGDSGHAQWPSPDPSRPMIPPTVQLSPAHQRALQRAFIQLEEQHFGAQLADYSGQPFARVLRAMPKAASRGLNRVIEAAILRCLNLAIRSIDQTAKGPPASQLSSLMAAINGGVSGFFGAAALPIELPLTTALRRRAIADTPRP